MQKDKKHGNTIDSWLRLYAKELSDIRLTGS